MATVHRGTYVAAGAGTAAITGSGELLALLLSTGSSGSQTATLYDDTAATPGSEILVLAIHAYRSPLFIRFPRDEAIPFTTGLYVANPNVDLALWIVEH